MEHPKGIGDRTTLAFMLALREAGYGLLVPFGENTRYDLVIESDDRLEKVQCGALRDRAREAPRARFSTALRSVDEVVG